MAGVASVAIGATSTVVLTADKGRSKATVQWISDDDTFLAFGVPAELNKGLKINADLPVYEIPIEYARVGVNAICASSAVTQTSEV